MAVDWTWTQVGQIGGFVLGLVFAVLIVLAVAIWLVGLLIRRISTGKAKAGDKKEGE